MMLTKQEQKRESVYLAAEKLVNLGQDPHPGLASWCIAMEQAYQALIAEVQKEIK